MSLLFGKIVALKCASYIAVPDLVRYVFKAASFARKDLGVPQLLRKCYKAPFADLFSAADCMDLNTKEYAK